MIKRVTVNVTEEEHGLWVEYVRVHDEIDSLSSAVRRMMNEGLGIETKPLGKAGRPSGRMNAESNGSVVAEEAASLQAHQSADGEADAPVKVSAVSAKRQIAEFFKKDTTEQKPLCDRCSQIGVALCEECLK